MRTIICMFAILAMARGVASAGAQAGPLRSPWDGRKVVLTDAAYECPAPPPFAKTMEIGTYYIDSKASVIDPKKKAEYDKAANVYLDLSRAAATAADAYLDKGSRAAALCVYSLLDAGELDVPLMVAGILKCHGCLQGQALDEVGLVDGQVTSVGRGYNQLGHASARAALKKITCEAGGGSESDVSV